MVRFPFSHGLRFSLLLLSCYLPLCAYITELCFYFAPFVSSSSPLSSHRISHSHLRISPYRPSTLVLFCFVLLIYLTPFPLCVKINICLSLPLLILIQSRFLHCSCRMKFKTQPRDHSSRDLDCSDQTAQSWPVCVVISRALIEFDLNVALIPFKYSGFFST